jgi:hypothetical protein
MKNTLFFEKEISYIKCRGASQLITGAYDCLAVPVSPDINRKRIAWTADIQTMMIPGISHARTHYVRKVSGDLVPQGQRQATTRLAVNRLVMTVVYGQVKPASWWRAVRVWRGQIPVVAQPMPVPQGEALDESTATERKNSNSHFKKFGMGMICPLPHRKGFHE